jgi:hypothetical protein
LCALVWVVVTVTTWVVETVCEIVADTVDIVVGLVKGLVDIVVGIVTGDWTRVLGGLIEIVAPVLKMAFDLLSIATLGTLVGAFVGNANNWALREHARDLLDKRFAGNDDMLMKARDALGIDSGGFGLRLQAVAPRLSLRSDFASQGDGVPDLVKLVRAGLDLKMLAGLSTPPAAWWNRPFPELVPDSGTISAADLDTYVAMGGVGPGVKQFSLFSMSKADLQSRLDVATMHGPELGLKLQWTIVDMRVTSADEILLDAVTNGKFAQVLTMPPFSRHDTTDMAKATMELCMPMAIGAFGFADDSFNGISAHLAGATCIEADANGSFDFPPNGVTGCAFRFRQPDVIFKYVAAHELGHTFGLCHASGGLRIMYTAAKLEKKSAFSWSALLQLWTNGVEAGFTLDEGKRVWDYIVMNFGTQCLTTRAF